MRTVLCFQLILRKINFYKTNKMGKTIIQQSAVIVLFICYLYLSHIESAMIMESTHFLKPEDVYENDKPGLQIFCHNANSKYLIHMWRSLTMHLNTNINNYDIYDGKSPQEVMEKHDDNQRSWNFNFFSTKRPNKFKMNPFEDVCVGVYVYPSNSHKYRISMTQTPMDISNLILMLLGAMIYWSARKLSGNPIFYYVCGITLGVTTSIIILVYFVSKLLPRGKLMYLMVATGWTMSFYLIQALWDNARLIAVQYREYVTWYILLTSLISFVICYRFGPVTNVRTKKLIEWCLQIAGLIMMYYSSYFHEASFFSCVVIVLLYNFPIVLIRRGRSYWKSMFPDRRRLLTENEYRIEGIKETNKALNELKGYCSSPDCNPWKTVLKLKDPIRFAKFMEGESHLSEDESREYDAEITRIIEECEYTDEEDDF
ncbi:nuclear envelope integral membrane protein 1 [Osmia bicornis bicornis]|uniref:nuclear envelope integral membrane protein 1 n=1 Tax=Osmia bicornis bicornis TaxID=1437191 RepID=UPI0010F6A1A2|nr:nuclear envelope integral membrane protein 1 [Osmia bicornis bicornis]